MAGKSGPKVSDTGTDQIKESSPEESVSHNVRTDTPGGESKKGTHIHITGPQTNKSS